MGWRTLDPITNVVFVIAVALAIMMAVCCSGCRTRETSHFKYNQHGLAEAIYSHETGFHFFSDGANKSLSPSFSVNGIEF